MNDSNDIFGIKPYGEALKTAVEKSADGVGKFLTAICLPAAEEFGFLLKDKLRYWRLSNIIKMIEKSKGKFDFDGKDLKINPRIGMGIIDHSSWQSDELILELWAGLLYTSSLSGEKDDSNLIFIELLKSLTGVQCRLIQHICSNLEITKDKNGLICTEKGLKINTKELQKITECDSIARLDLEIDHLRSLDLIPSGQFANDSGFVMNQEDFTSVSIRPTALMLHLYQKTNGIVE